MLECFVDCGISIFRMRFLLLTPVSFLFKHSFHRFSLCSFLVIEDSYLYTPSRIATATSVDPETLENLETLATKEAGGKQDYIGD